MRARLLTPLVVLALAAGGCAAERPLTRRVARELGERRWRAPPDEVFDATWLTLRAAGCEVTAADRVAGTLVARWRGRRWALDVSARGDEQRVVAVPEDERATRGELSELLDALEGGTRRLLGAWRELPEWRYDGRRNVLAVPGFSASPPREWEWLDLDVTRRQVVVQQRRARVSANPTLVVELDRVRPESTLGVTLKKAAGLALTARQRLVFPDELTSSEDGAGLHGEATLLDGTVPQAVAWHALEERVGDAGVRWVMVCPRAVAGECAAAWQRLVRSIVR